MGKFEQALAPLKWMMLFSGVINILMLAIPIYSLQLFTRVLTNYSVETLIVLTLLVVFLVVIQSLLDYVRQQGLLRVGLNVNSALAEDAVQLSLLARSRNQRTADQFTLDVFSLSKVFSSGSLYHLFDMPWTPLFVVALFIIHPLIGGLTVAVSLIIIVLSIVLSKIHLQRPKPNHHSVLASHAIVSDAIVSMGMLKGVSSGWDHQNRAFLDDELKVNTQVGLVLTVTKAVRLILQACVMGLAVYLAILGEVLPGAIIAASIIVSRALAPIEQSITFWRSWSDAYQSYKRIRDVYTKLPVAVESGLVKAEGSLVVDQMYFAPVDPAKPLLKAVSLELTQGSSYLIMGNSGSGKTSLLKVLLGIVKPQQGHVLLNGMEVSHWVDKGLGRSFGYLPQSISLISGTIAQNISHFQEVDEDELYRVAVLCGIHELIMQLPQGYDTVVGPDSAPLSRGQMQLLGLARAVYGSPYLVCLDEPNSALDVQGEKILLEVLASLKDAGTTVVMVSHKKSVLRSFDYMIQLEQGRLLQCAPITVVGTPAAAIRGAKANGQGLADGGRAL